MCLSSYKLFSFKKIAEKGGRFGLFQYKLLGTRNDVSLDPTGVPIFNSDIDIDQFPLFISFDIVVSLVDPETFTIKSKNSRPRLIRDMFSRFHLHSKKMNEDILFLAKM